MTTHFVPAIGTTRRAQALRWLGFTRTHVADLTGVSTSTLRRLEHDQPVVVSRETAARIRVVYAQHEGAPAAPVDPATVAAQRALAERAGWVPPLAWDDPDDPLERPKGVGGGRNRVYVDEAVWLLEAGEAPRVVAERLGIEQASLARRLRANGFWELSRLCERVNS